jgi:hypothetical protein
VDRNIFSNKKKSLNGVPQNLNFFKIFLFLIVVTGVVYFNNVFYDTVYCKPILNKSMVGNNIVYFLGDINQSILNDIIINLKLTDFSKTHYRILKSDGDFDRRSALAHPFITSLQWQQ